MPTTSCEVTFPDGRTVVRHVHGDTPPGTGRIVTIDGEDGPWHVDRATIKGYAEKYIDGQRVWAGITVVPVPPDNATGYVQ